MSLDGSERTFLNFGDFFEGQTAILAKQEYFLFRRPQEEQFFAHALVHLGRFENMRGIRLHADEAQLFAGKLT